MTYLIRNGSRLVRASLAMLVLAPCLSAQEPAGPRLRVAVMNLTEDAFTGTTEYGATSTTTTVAIPPPSGFALGLTEMLTTALVETGRFVVVERAEVDAVLEEQDLGASGRVAGRSAAAQGRVLGVQAILAGGITEYTYTSSSLGGNVRVLNRVRAGAQEVKAMVALDIRLIDAETGEVIASERGEGDASSRSLSADALIGDNEFGTAVAASTPLGQASREALEEIVSAVVEALADVPWSGRVIDVRGEHVYINAGADVGIEAGMELAVFEQQEALVDPETGLTLGAPERLIGALRITQVDAKYAVAELTDGAGVAANHVVRLVGQPAKP